MATRIVMMLLGLILILAVACGTAAAPDPTAAPAAGPTAAPVESDPSQPTATPQAAAPPAEVEVNPGKLTLMVGDLASERFDKTFVAGAPGSLNYGRLLHGFLISDDEKREMVPGIAKEWSLSDDGLTWTFTIREGVKFHDGSEVTPEDALWTIQHAFGPQSLEYAIHTSSMVITRQMIRIELTGPDQVSLTTKQPVIQIGDFLSEVGPHWYGVIPKRAELHDKEVELAYDNNPIGAGPMSLEEHVSASVMTFERFDDFYYQPDNGFPEDKRVNFQSLDLFLAPEEATRVAAIRAGEADIAPVSLAAKEQVQDGGGRIVFGQEGVYVNAYLIACYEPQHPCHDQRVRQALEYAINKELIQNQLYGGPQVFQVKGWGVVTPSAIGYTPELDARPFDPDKARQLLADAGYPGGEGFGKLIVNTYPSTSMPLQIEAAQLAADFWRRELGLDVEVRVGDDTGTDQREKAGELNGQILWRDNEARKDATGIVAQSYGDPKYETRKHEDPELFRLTQDALQIVDAGKRAEASKELYQRLRDESYQLSIGYVNIPWAVGPRVLTWQPYPLSVHISAPHTITLK